jgi:hypothetical protein
MASRITVGETRAFLAAHYGVPHREDTQYVIVAEAVNGMTVGTCCDGTAEAAGMLRTALREIGAALPALAPGSPSVIVGRDDLRAVLNARPCANAEALSRLRDAMGEDENHG